MRYSVAHLLAFICGARNYFLTPSKSAAKGVSKTLDRCSAFHAICPAVGQSSSIPKKRMTS
jgi:hypothetical protein